MDHIAMQPLHNPSSGHNSSVNYVELEDVKTSTTEPNYVQSTAANDIQKYEQSDFIEPRCCCGKYASYPTYWPRTFCFHSIVSSVSNIAGYVSDIWLAVDAISFGTNGNFVEIEDDELWRVVFTFVPGIVIVVWLASTTLVAIAAQWRAGGIGCFGCCCVLAIILVLFCVCAIGYKVIMIVIAIVNLKALWKHKFCLKNHTAAMTVPSYLIEKISEQDKVFLIDAFISSWGLWIISLISLQTWMSEEKNNGTLFSSVPSITHVMLWIKVICGFFSMLNYSNQAKFFSQHVEKKDIILFKCEYCGGQLMIMEKSMYLEENDATCKYCKLSVGNHRNVLHCGNCQVHFDQDESKNIMCGKVYVCFGCAFRVCYSLYQDKEAMEQICQQQKIDLANKPFLDLFPMSLKLVFIPYYNDFLDKFERKLSMVADSERFDEEDSKSDVNLSVGDEMVETNDTDNHQKMKIMGIIFQNQKNDLVYERNAVELVNDEIVKINAKNDTGIFIIVACVSTLTHRVIFQHHGDEYSWYLKDCLMFIYIYTCLSIFAVIIQGCLGTKNDKNKDKNRDDKIQDQDIRPQLNEREQIKLVQKKANSKCYQLGVFLLTWCANLMSFLGLTGVIMILGDWNTFVHYDLWARIGAWLAALNVAVLGIYVVLCPCCQITADLCTCCKFMPANTPSERN